ncbi:MAG TPA: tetratricopeptide repeat-containing protein [Streptosporangiaceae bacterium]
MTNLPRPEDVTAAAGLNAPPRRPAMAFAGREPALRRLRDALSRDANVVITPAADAPPGVGATELALQYAAACRDRYRLIGWVSAATAESITAGLAALAARIAPGLGGTVRTQVAAGWALSWLRAHRDWLLVLDDVEDAELVQPLVDRLDTGHIVTIGRRAGLDRPAVAIELDVLDPDAAAGLLMEATGGAGRAGDAGPGRHRDREAAGRIAAELGRLPLALAQAAAYVGETDTGLPHYLELLRERPPDMYAPAPDGGSAPPAAAAAHRAVARVWDITRCALEERDPRAVRLLYVLAWYAPQEIPRELIAPDEGGDATAIDAALDLLASYRMIDRAGAAVVPHRLVQSVLRGEAAAADRDIPPGRDTALDWLVRAIPVAPAANPAGWPLWRRLTVHVEALAGRYGGGAKPAPLGMLFTETARFHSAQAGYAEALACWQRALDIREAALGPDHLDVAWTLTRIARTYRLLGRVPEALPPQERALAITERLLGPDHPDVASVLGSLARYYRLLGRMAAALPLAGRQLAINEKTFGGDHPAVATALGNLAGVNRELGRVAEALPLARRALAIAQDALGPDHPDVATALANLALTFKALGRAGEALPLEERALAITEAALGPDHPDVAVRLGDLAATYSGLGRPGEALPLEERALAITEGALGPDHPDVAVRLGNLASTYSGLGRPADALPLEERALAITEAALGADHPHVATALGNLASTYCQLGRVEDALPLEERALAITEESLGARHPHVATAMGNLALTCKALGLVGEALPLEERALTITEEALGADHPDVAIRLGNLAGTYRTLGWAEESLPLERQALAIAEGAFGAHHPDVATALGNLASSYCRLGRIAEALALEERALAITEEALGPDHPDVAIRVGNLAFTNLQLGRTDEARAGARRAYACALAGLGRAHPTTEWALQLCRDLGIDPGTGTSPDMA